MKREDRRAVLGEFGAENPVAVWGVMAETLMKIEEIMEVGAGAGAQDEALLEEAEAVVGELLAMFVYKEELSGQFGAREERAKRWLEKVRSR